MAKGHISDDDLTKGLRNFGGLSSFGAQGGKPLRDSPFRVSEPEVQARPVEPVRKVVPQPAAKPLENKAVQERRGEERLPPQALPEKPIVPKVAVRKIEAREKVSREERQREKKTERYTERVTVLLDAELRDGAEGLAKELSRRRKEKGGERITANTIMRVALRLVLEKCELSPADAPEDEEEIFAAVCERIKPKKA